MNLARAILTHAQSTACGACGGLGNRAVSRVTLVPRPVGGFASHQSMVGKFAKERTMRLKLVDQELTAPSTTVSFTKWTKYNRTRVTSRDVPLN